MALDFRAKQSVDQAAIHGSKRQQFRNRRMVKRPRTKYALRNSSVPRAPLLGACGGDSADAVATMENHVGKSNKTTQPKTAPQKNLKNSAAKTTAAMGGNRAERPTTSKDAGGKRQATSGKPALSVRENSKLGIVISMLRQPKGTTIEALRKATGWQAHSVRGALSGAIKKKLALNVQSVKTGGVRTYRIAG